MMRRVNELAFDGDPADMVELFRRIEGRSEDRWRRDRESEERLERMNERPFGGYCFSRREGSGLPAASLWLHRDGFTGYAVTNVIPEGRDRLSDDQYNGILAAFEAELLRPLIQAMRVEVHTKPSADKFEESLSVDATKALRAFSATANRGGLHTLDWKRWDRFLIRVHLDGPTLDGPDLDWWLETQGWPAERRRELVGSYERSLSLLAEYDEERVSP